MVFGLLVVTGLKQQHFEQQVNFNLEVILHFKNKVLSYNNHALYVLKRHWYRLEHYQMVSLSQNNFSTSLIFIFSHNTTFKFRFQLYDSPRTFDASGKLHSLKLFKPTDLMNSFNILLQGISDGEVFYIIIKSEKDRLLIYLHLTLYTVL